MKKINRAGIIKRLISRFLLTRASDETFEISETVLPITNVDELLRLTKFATYTVLTPGTGHLTLMTVPAGKRYHIKAFQIYSVTSSETNGVLIEDTSIPGELALASYTATANYITGMLNQPIMLDQGQSMVTDVSTAGTNVVLVIYYEEEDAF